MFFKKRRGRKKKIPLGTKILRWAIGVFFVCIIIPIILVGLIFSDFLFVFLHATKFLGDSNSPKTYLVTLHNEGELRPELGFLTSFAFVSISNGTIDFEFHDSYDVAQAPKKITAPNAIESRFKDAPKYAGWTFRDANFFLEHPQNATTIIEFLQHDNRYAHKTIDGVISLNLYAIGQIIQSVGGIDINGTKITPENIFSLLEQESKDFDHHSKEEWENRKNTLKPLSDTLIQEIVFSPLHWKNFSRTAKNLLDQKHILLFFPDNDLQKIFTNNTDRKHWLGKIFLPPDDLLLGTNIANIGGRKGDRYIRKQFFSTFTVSPRGKITETFRINLQHEGTRTLYSDRYFAEIQIIRKTGTKLQNSSSKEMTTNSIRTLNGNDLEIFSFPVTIDPGKSKNFEFTFTHPQRLKPGDEVPIFSLHQAGVITQQIFITFQGYGNTSFAFSGCDTSKNTENISECQYADTQDRNIQVEMNTDTQTPLLERSKFIEDNTKAEIVFSEKLQNILPSQVLLREKESGKSIPIQWVRVEDKSLILRFTEPVKPSKKTFYTLQIDGLSDISNNAIDLYRTTLVLPNQY